MGLSIKMDSLLYRKNPDGTIGQIYKLSHWISPEFYASPKDSVSDDTWVVMMYEVCW